MTKYTRPLPNIEVVIQDIEDALAASQKSRNSFTLDNYKKFGGLFDGRSLRRYGGFEFLKRNSNLDYSGDEPIMRSTTTELKKVLFIPDCHVPYHDAKAWNLMMAAAREFEPDTIVILGDFADFYAVSAYEKDPRRPNDLSDELAIVEEKLDELDALGASKKIYICGNHEDRLERYLISRAPALFGSVTIPATLHLAERGWQFIQYKRSFKLGKLHLTHDTGTAGINAHRQSMAAFQGSVIIGHTHRMEVSVLGNAAGAPQIGAMFGWLGDFDKVDYMHAIKARRDWVHGFGIGYQESNGVIHLQPIPIVEGTCVVNGKLIR